MIVVLLIVQDLGCITGFVLTNKYVYKTRDPQ